MEDAFVQTPVALIVYVVVVVGDINLFPLLLTDPIPWLRVADVMLPVDVHLKVVDPPTIIDELSAVKFIVVGKFKSRVTLLVVVPPIPVAVKVYVVVDDGDTDLLPEVATDPIPWSIETLLT